MKPGSRRVTLRDVASVVGVSTSLVSKALSGRMGTSSVTPQRIAEIREAAARLGYYKNASALALLTRRQQVLGVFIHRVGTAGSGLTEELLEGISAACRRRQQRLSLAFFETAAEFGALAALANPGSMDGVMLAGLAHPEIIDQLLHVRDTGVPVVTVHNEPLHPSLPNVGVDQAAVSYLATAHLIASGATRIAHLRVTSDRYKGYRQALRDANMPFDDRYVCLLRRRAAFSLDAGVEAATELLARGIRIDGIVAQSDQQAMGAIRVLLAQGFGVPECVRVVGVDNSPYCALLPTGLSSVSQQYRERGEAAVEMLLDLVEGRAAASMCVPPRLFVRASSSNGS